MKKQTDREKITALYERLSHDDGRSDESVSIENQKRILEDYARKMGFTNLRHFTDVYNQRLIPFDTKMAVKMIK